MIQTSHTSGPGEKWLNSGYILQVELRNLCANWLGGEHKRGIKDDSQVFGPSDLARMELPFTMMERQRVAGQG